MKKKTKPPLEETEPRADPMPAEAPEPSPAERAKLAELENEMLDAGHGIVLGEPSKSDLYWEQEYRDEPAPPWESEDEVLAKLKAKKQSKFDEWVRAEVAWAVDHHEVDDGSAFSGGSWADALRRRPKSRDYNAVAVALVVERGDMSLLVALLRNPNHPLAEATRMLTAELLTGEHKLRRGAKKKSAAARLATPMNKAMVAFREIRDILPRGYPDRKKQGRARALEIAARWHRVAQNTLAKRA